MLKQKHSFKDLITALEKQGINVVLRQSENGKIYGITYVDHQTTLGMGESYVNLNFIWKHILFEILLNKAFKDHQLQEIEIIHSNLDYTIVRPSALTDGKITNQYKIGFDVKYNNLSLKIVRAEVADFMLRQLKTEEYLKKAVSKSN